MSRENVAAKGRRYLTEGRLIVSDITGDAITATVRGDATVYAVSHQRGRGWACDCPARGRCAHMVAVGLVVVVRSSETNR